MTDTLKHGKPTAVKAIGAKWYYPAVTVEFGRQPLPQLDRQRTRASAVAVARRYLREWAKAAKTTLRLKAEIDRLKSILRVAHKLTDAAIDDYNDAKAEVERLTRDLEAATAFVLDLETENNQLRHKGSRQ